MNRQTRIYTCSRSSRFGRTCFTIALLLAPAYFSTADAQAGEGNRRHDLYWTVSVDGIPEDAGLAKIWIALPQELPEQAVTGLTVGTDYRWTYAEDPDFGNRVVMVEAKNPPPGFEVVLEATVIRRPVNRPIREPLDERTRALCLREEALATIGPRVYTIADRLDPGQRPLYDYVLNHMDYDKSVPGWGKGDTERACDVRKGNCTDFHSLFLSLSRARGVPALFEMGYPTKREGEKDRTGGYHCWAWYWEGDTRYPVDISEADKAPEKTDFFFGRLDADRITFSRGRDVRLPGMAGKPLNYLPSGAYAEVDGEPFHGITRSISYPGTR